MYNFFLVSGTNVIEIPFDENDKVLARKVTDSNGFSIMVEPRFVSVKNLVDTNGSAGPVWQNFAIHSPFASPNSNPWLRIQKVERLT